MNIEHICIAVQHSSRYHNPIQFGNYESYTLDNSVFEHCGLYIDLGCTITLESFTGTVDPHIDVGPRTQHIAILLSAEPVQFYQGRGYTVHRGDIIRIHSKVLHSATVISGGFAQFLCVQYSGDIPETVLSQCINVV